MVSENTPPRRIISLIISELKSRIASKNIQITIAANNTPRHLFSQK